MINTVIADYRIIREIGSGGMGNVYFAQHKDISMFAAIKKLHDKYTKDDMFIQRFRQEASKLFELKHPNITDILHFKSNAHGHFIIMEYVEGIELQEYIINPNKRLNISQINNIMTQILDGIYFAHERKIVHRDLKPGNVIVTEEKGEMKVKIMDFGISKKLEENLGLTTVGARIGTPLYMSPEQVEEYPITIKTDIYSLGVVYFELLAGKKLYDKKKLTKGQIFDKIKKDPLPPINQFNNQVPFALQGIIDKATQKNPINRYKNCLEFKKAIEESESLELLRQQKILRKKTTYVSFIFALVIILLIFILIILLKLN